jgi:hypothetical protein
MKEVNKNPLIYQQAANPMERLNQNLLQCKEIFRNGLNSPLLSYFFLTSASAQQTE